VVLAAGDPASSQAADALEQLCHTYWYPLYVFIRRRGHTPEDARNLTQEFFAEERRRFPSRSPASKNAMRGNPLKCGC
jgi:hypothetical protein